MEGNIFEAVTAVIIIVIWAIVLRTFAVVSGFGILP